MAKRKKVEVYEGQFLEQNILSDEGHVLCKSGTIITPELIRRLSNWVIQVEPGKKKKEEEATGGTVASVNREQILRRLEFDEIVSQKTRASLQKGGEEFFGKVHKGDSNMELGSLRNAVAAMVDETPDNPDVPLKLFQLKEHSSYLYQHGIECGVLASFVASAMNVPFQDVTAFATAMMLHDTGMMAIPDTILKKTAPLTAEEWGHIRRHPDLGFETLCSVPGVDPLTLMIAKAHHSLADGTGYPDDVDFASLSPLVYMSTIINDFEALTADYRPFQRPVSLHGAVTALLKYRRRYHSPTLDNFVRVVGVYPISTFLSLNTGETGVVVRNNPENLFLPEIKLVLDPQGKEYSKEIIVNLLTETDRRIAAVREDL